MKTPAHFLFERWTGLLLLVCLITIACTAELNGQDSPASEATRAGQIQSERAQKDSQLHPDGRSPFEKNLIKIQDIARRLFGGSPVRLVIGGLPPGGGLGIGPSWEQKAAADQVVFRLWATGSFESFYNARSAVELPKVAGGPFSLAFEGGRLDAPYLDYYGSGPNTTEEGRTTYRLEDTGFNVRGRWQPDHLPLSGELEAGMMFINVGPGQSPTFASSDSVYGPLEAPGIDVQTNFFRAGYAIDLDLRDMPKDPHGGTHLKVGYGHYVDLKRDQFSFGRLSAQAEQYFPFYNKKRVIALRAAADLSFTAAGQVVPFYLQPTLGGSHDLRGFKPYRFSDDNLIVMNAEYRWEVSNRFDMAVFGDTGRVFHRRSQFGLSHVQTSAGFGFRFKSRQSFLVKFDTGFSREGVQLWLNFKNIF